MPDGLSVAPPALIAYLRDHGIEPEILAPGVPMPTVPLAAAAIGVAESAIIKSLLFQTKDGRCVLAIASGPDRVSRAAVAAAVGYPSCGLASPEVVLAVTGYPAGGVSPVAHREAVPVVVDRRVTELAEVYGGAGSEKLLLRLSTADLLRLTRAVVADILQPVG